MSYILGFIAADGTVIDARKSSRTCYTTIAIQDRTLLEEIKKTMGSNHEIYTKSAHYRKFDNKSYFCKEISILRIGSKVLFQDLVNLGITPRKSLSLGLPKMQSKYFPYFLRGYFDGDGCINLYFSNGSTSPNLQIIFTSGSQKLLVSINERLAEILQLQKTKIYYNQGAHRLKYRKSAGIKIIQFMYQNLYMAPFLERKYSKAKIFI